MNALALLVGRILLASVFITFGSRQLFLGGAPGIAETLANHGFPFPLPLTYASATCQLIGGLMLVIGLWPRFAAIALAIFVAVLAAVFHNFWAMEGAARAQNLTLFYFHLTTLGGLIYVAVFGAGRFAVHHR